VPVRTWSLALPIDRADPAPVVRQVARGIASHVAAGRLRPGERLPGSRELARILAVHRNTVVAAYAELLAEGWVQSSGGRGTFVSSEIPAALRRRGDGRPRARASAFALGPAPSPRRATQPVRGVLPLVSGSPDLRLVPVAAIARAYRRALRRPGILGYGDPAGEERLRIAIGAMLRSTRGLDPDPAGLLVTRGSQLALTVTARALFRPGDVVAVEALGYPPAWDAFRAAGARLVPVPLDGDGLRVDALEALVRRERVRALYLTPHHQYPTTVTLPAARRVALLRLAAAERIAVVEDDYDSEFHYDGAPVLPLAANDPAGAVVHIGTLSKILAPALRIGYVHAAPEVIRCLAEHRRNVDRQGDRALEVALAELIEDGELQQHVWRMRRRYAARRQALAETLRERLAGALSFAFPAGGMALWCRTAPRIDADRWADEGPRAGVLFHSGRDFTFDEGPYPALQLGFALLDERELREAVRRMAAALERIGGARGGRALPSPGRANVR
jgi:GntR family transcriptional regulator / MocR family aminotransferase